MRRTLLALFLVLTLPAAAQNLLQHERLGPLKIGLPQARVLALLGPPADQSEENYEAATGRWVQTWSYPSQGLILKMGGQRQGSPKALDDVQAYGPCRLKTARGIGIGSTRAEVLSAYQGLIDPSLSQESQVVVGSIYGGLIFTFREGKVSRIFLGAAAE
ncbi:MAG TPA: hypothetical protein VNO81_13145 [Candidatus Nitrosotenuis sp.]|nr:hypothetical protein [Candidatus Nitrosotenuis sp.]